MKFTRALYKAQKGIDACIDLQGMYMDELQQADSMTEVQRALDCLNAVCSKLMITENSQ